MGRYFAILFAILLFESIHKSTLLRFKSVFLASNATEVSKHTCVLMRFFYLLELVNKVLFLV